MFDVNDFLNTQFTEVPPDKSTPLPEGEYNAQVATDDKGLALASGTTKDGNAWKRLDVRLKIADPAGVLKATHGENPGITYGIMLDLDSNDRLDMGANRNVKLGKLLEATGKRKTGWKFTDLYGAQVKVKIKHEPDRNDPTIVRSNVVAVAPLGG